MWLALRKLVWVFEFWNEMLVPNVKRKNLLKGRVSESFFWKEKGWEINGLSPFSWQFFWNLWPLSCFQRLRVLKQFRFKKLKYHNLRLWYFLSEQTYYCRNLIVFSCLQFADCYIWPRIFCGVILCWITVTESFLKSFVLNKITMISLNFGCKLFRIMVLSKTCVLVFEIISLKVFEQGWSNQSFPIEF